MTKRRTYIVIFLIFILAFLAGNFSYPKYLNQAVDFFNHNFKLALPHFPDLPFKLGLDLQGGSHLLYEADLSKIEKKDYSSAMQGLRDVIEKRVNLFGIQEPLVQIQEEAGRYRLIVELAGIKNVSEAIKMIGQTPFLEFKEQRPEEETKKILEKIKEVEGKSFEEVQKIADWQLALEDPYFQSTPLTGKYLKKAEIGFEPNAQKPLVLLQFNDEGTKIFKDLTTKNVGKPIAIYIDQVLISAPIVEEPIPQGRAQITGNFTVAEVKKLVTNLNSGALPVPIKLVSQQSVGPTLGQVSLEKSLKAGIIGFLAVIIFMVVFYRLPGLLASLALVIYLALILTLFKLIPVTLTLAGIAGFILSIGMAVDANILIFARMREELNQGKGLSLAVEDGFRRAWPSIRDSNFNSIIVTIILFGFGVGFVKGFALTLMLGIILSLFSAIFLTRSFLRIVEDSELGRVGWLW